MIKLKTLHDYAPLKINLSKEWRLVKKCERLTGSSARSDSLLEGARRRKKRWERGRGRRNQRRETTELFDLWTGGGGVVAVVWWPDDCQVGRCAVCSFPVFQRPEVPRRRGHARPHFCGHIPCGHLWFRWTLKNVFEKVYFRKRFSISVRISFAYDRSLLGLQHSAGERERDTHTF